MGKNTNRHLLEAELNEKNIVDNRIHIKIAYIDRFEIKERIKKDIVIHYNEKDRSKLKTWVDNACECILTITRTNIESVECLIKLNKKSISGKFNPLEPQNLCEIFQLEIIEIID